MITWRMKFGKDCEVLDMKVSFDNCQNLIDCVSRYLYYKEIVADEDLPVLDFVFRTTVKERYE